MFSLRSALLLLLVLGTISSAAAQTCAPPSADRTVSICAPADSAVLGSSFQVTAAATSSQGVRFLQIYLDGVKVFHVDAAQLNTTLTGVADGEHRLTVLAKDAISTFQKSIRITVGTAACAPPTTDRTVRICTPADGATVPASTRVTAAARSSAGVSFLQIYLDGVKVFHVNGAVLDTTVNLTPGRHRLVVLAKDSIGTFQSTIFVTTASCSPPAADQTVRICSPSDGATLQSPLTVAAAARDADGVSLMEVWLSGKKVFSSAGDTLQASIASGTGQQRLTVLAKDRLGNTFTSTIFVFVTPAPIPPGLDKVKHIIFYMQENRSFDHYFGRMGQYRRDRGFTDPFDELPLNVAIPDTAGHLIKPFKMRTVCHENMSPAWNESHASYNNGRMDGFLIQSKSVPSTIDPHGTRGMGYFDWTDIPYYYELAFQFSTSDRFFASLLGPTIPNRMYLFAATSFGHIRPDPPPTGGWPQPTIFDKLTQAGVPWRYYYHDNSVFLADWQTWSRDAGKVRHIDNYYADLANGTLPPVVFLERAAQLALDEHPGTNLQKGVANTKKLIDALMNSSAWESSVFILLFDEGGGFYDHVAPPNVPKPDTIPPMLRSTDLPGDFDRLGFRVPFIVVSPFAKPHLVSHRVRDITSVLKLIETRFGLPPLTQRDGWADDMTEFFDFDNPQWLTPPALPAQPITGVCDRTLETAPDH